MSDAKKSRFVGVCGWMMVMLLGCDNQPTGTPTVSGQGGSVQATQQQAAVEQQAPAEAPEVGYSPVGKRDPFRSYLADLDQTKNFDPDRRIEDTERYELDAYKLVGLITATSQPRALVEDPTGRGHVLHLGSRLGKRNGKVTRMLNNSLIITEEFVAPTGERVRVPITIKLRVDEEGDGSKKMGVEAASDVGRSDQSVADQQESSP